MDKIILTPELAKKMCDYAYNNITSTKKYYDVLAEEFEKNGLTELTVNELIDYLEVEYKDDASDDNATLDVKSYNLSDSIGIDVKSYKYSKRGQRKEEIYARVVLGADGSINVPTRNCRVEFLNKFKSIGIKTTEERFNMETNKLKKQAVKEINISKFPEVVELIGTPKQIAWAEKIRLETITKILKYIDGLDKYKMESPEVSTEIINSIKIRLNNTLKQLSSEESSKIWIETRSNNYISVGNYDESDILSTITRKYI